MKIIPYTYPYKSLVNLTIGVGCGLLIRASGLPAWAGWTVVIVVTAVLYVVLNYRFSTARAEEKSDSADKSETA